MRICIKINDISSLTHFWALIITPQINEVIYTFRNKLWTLGSFHWCLESTVLRLLKAVKILQSFTPTFPKSQILKNWVYYGYFLAVLFPSQFVEYQKSQLKYLYHHWCQFCYVFNTSKPLVLSFQLYISNWKLIQIYIILFLTEFVISMFFWEKSSRSFKIQVLVCISLEMCNVTSLNHPCPCLTLIEYC